MSKFIHKLIALLLVLTVTSPVLAQNPVTTTYVNAQKQASPPANPPAGYNRIWVGTDNFVKVKQPDGTTQFMPYYLSSLDGIVLATSGVLSQFAPAPGGGDAAKFLRGDGTWADAGAAGFALQTQTSFTNNSTPAIYLKAPGPNTTPFLQFLDSTDASVLKVYYDGGIESAGDFYTATGKFATTGTSITLQTAGDTDVGVFREYGSLSFEGAVPSTSGVPKAWLDFTGVQGNTGITASTEYNAFWYNPPRTYTWAAGAITNQRFFYMRAPTIAFGGASTVTNAATVAISGAPIAGTNATISNAYALWVASGLSQFDGRINAVNSDASNPSVQAQNDTGTALRGISLSGYGAYLTSRSSIGANIAQTGTLSGNTTAATALIKREHVLSGFTSTGPVLQVEQATGTGNLLSLVNSGGTQAAFDQNGVLLIGGASSPRGSNVKLQLGTPASGHNYVNLYLEPTGTGVTPLAIQGNDAGQAVDLFQVFNSAGTKTFRIDNRGLPSASPTGADSTNLLMGHQASSVYDPGSYLTGLGYRVFQYASGGSHNVVVGAESAVNLTGSYNVILGSQTVWLENSLANSVIIGQGAFQQSAATYTGTGSLFLVGRGVGTDLTTQDNLAAFGSSIAPYNDWYFGRGYSATAPSDVTFQPSIGSGTNIAGASFYLKGGAGTGNATPGKLYLQYASAGSSGATVQSYTTAVTIDSSATDVGGLLQVDRIAGTTSAPSISAGAAAGTTPTVSVTGTDLGGEIVVTTGTGSVGSGTLATITLNVAFANDCYPVLQAADADSRGVAVNITHSSTGFTIVAGAVGWATSTEYRWTYIVAGR